MIRSIRVRLLLLLTSFLCLVCLLLVLATWWKTREEVYRLFDSQLVQMARMLAVSTEHEHEERDLYAFALDLRRQGYEYPVLFQVRSKEGRLLIRGPGTPSSPLTADRQEGYSTGRFFDQDWRVYTLITHDSHHRIQVAHSRSVRDELINQFMLNILPPLLLVLVVPAVLWLGITRGLAPLRRIADQLRESDPERLTPLFDARAPEEIQPLLNAIHILFVRLQQALDRYRRFTADAAHELRTPVAGAVIQAQAALGADGEGDCRQSLEQVLTGLQRLSHLLDQLLALGRAGREGTDSLAERVNLRLVATDVVADMGPQAFEKGVDIELHADRESLVIGNADLVAVLLRNLIDNAIRATPAGGMLRVLLEPETDAAGPCLIVEDTGSGIPDEQKGRVLERFKRLPGTPGSGAGLGLSIVQAVAEIHGARMRLEDREPPPGLRVSVYFPHGI